MRLSVTIDLSSPERKRQQQHDAIRRLVPLVEPLVPSLVEWLHAKRSPAKARTGFFTVEVPPSGFLDIIEACQALVDAEDDGPGEEPKTMREALERLWRMVSAQQRGQKAKDYATRIADLLARKPNNDGDHDA